MRNQILLLPLLVLGMSPCLAQSFEGVITFKVSSHKENVSTMTVKGDKNILEVEIDSTETIKRINDTSAETSVVLRKKQDLMYGFRSNELHGTYHEEDPINASEHKIEISMTGEVRQIGEYHCTKIKLQSPEGMAEAWITKELGFRLTQYFPAFLGGEAHPGLYSIRQVANQEGFIMHYTESLKGTNDMTVFEMTVVEKEIPNAVFVIDPAYHVLDENGMKRLYQEAQGDPSKMVQWDEFMQIFGSK